MEVKEYIELKLLEINNIRQLNVQEELWNILYNLLNDYKIKHNDKIHKSKKECREYVDSRIVEIFNYYPDK